MAGLGETCTHVAAVLFYLEALNRLQGSETCTGRKCEWIMPKFKKDMQYLPIKEIDFSSAKMKKRKLDEAIDCGDSTDLNDDKTPADKVPLCNKKELESFYDSLSESNTRPAILSLIPKYSSTYVPKHTMLNEFPQSLQLLYDPNLLKLNYSELLQKCELVNIAVTEGMALNVEQSTREQHNSSLWFKFRSGRITASDMKSVCHTDAANPAQSVIKQICYPHSFKFSSTQTEWGCAHEKPGKNRYESTMKGLHNNFSVLNTGLIINPEWPYLGATPDGKVSCSCCGNGILEIKCPYSHKESTIDDATQDKNFCLKKDSGGRITLKNSHAYYYQVQTQLFIANVDYCDFCVCTFPQNKVDDIFIERIGKDAQFWSNCIDQAQRFFCTCILPELLGKWYTRSNKVYAIDFGASSSNISTSCASTSVSTESSNIASTSVDNSELHYYCYCRGSEDSGDMIGCDNDECKIEWFHLYCLKIKTVPKGKWYCPECRKLSQFSRRSKKQKM